jgi:hypothetical protein
MTVCRRTETRRRAAISFRNPLDHAKMANNSGRRKREAMLFSRACAAQARRIIGHELDRDDERARR